jgi:hypothetical protein
VGGGDLMMGGDIAASGRPEHHIRHFKVDVAWWVVAVGADAAGHRRWWRVQEVVICDRTTLRRGFVDQDQLEQFSVKQEQNRHT